MFSRCAAFWRAAKTAMYFNGLYNESIEATLKRWYRKNGIALLWVIKQNSTVKRNGCRFTNGILAQAHFQECRSKVFSRGFRNILSW